MKSRINRVTTRSGDGGETGLADGSRLSKAAPRVDAMGDVDETNAAIGLLRAALAADDPLQG
ncbi:MAG: ATP:cob(I)alamin adenosyltransferase, partial [Pseudomonadales bacterium]|nr:ATP:cob(I)alamin adenosyltransferase [Pseudomonadales bacterium]